MGTSPPRITPGTYQTRQPRRAYRHQCTTTRGDEQRDTNKRHAILRNRLENMMRIQSIHLRSFKRFTDLTITDIPESAKLVLVIGPNGCGKSSIFDAILDWSRIVQYQHSPLSDESYYSKATASPEQAATHIAIQIHGPQETERGVYVRTAYRNEADFHANELRQSSDPARRLQTQRLIDDDKSVSENYQRLIFDTIHALYDVEDPDQSAIAVRDELIGEIGSSLRRLFDDLILRNISPPAGSSERAGAFYFKKGSVDSYHYKNLSRGEKAVFDLILDLHLKKPFFPSSIYCIDELELHLQTSLQGKLLEELMRIIPDSGQLWITTHSLGVLRAAQKVEADTPGITCILDFEGVSPDEPNTLRPARLDSVAWKKMLNMAIDDLSDRLAPEHMIVCEGSSRGSRRRDFDAAVYNRILGSQRPDVVFVSGGSANEAIANGERLRDLLMACLPATKVVTLIDRDDRSDEEISRLPPWTLVLARRNIESYLLADDTLAKFLADEGKSEFLDQVLQVKSEVLSQGPSGDDLKPAAGTIYNSLKSLLGLKSRGSNSDQFMRDTLARHIVPGMTTYDELYDDVITQLERSTAKPHNLESPQQP